MHNRDAHGELTFYYPVTNHDNFLPGCDSDSFTASYFCKTKYRIAST
jgi:hypothetical protein